MKHILFALIAALAWSACQNEPSPKTANELEKIKAELEAKKKELSDKQQIAAIEQELNEVERQIRTVDRTGQAPAPSPADVPAAIAEQAVSAPAQAAVPASKPRIMGTSVTMRKEASVKSDKLGSFNNNEEVTVLETKNVNNENEAILTKPIQLYVSESNSGDVAMTLPKGKAVVIEKYDADDNKYEVSYQAGDKGKLFAGISADAVETISYSTWYRVKRANGEEGWVLGKFLKQ
jgi:uncharacterized protein YqfB (UPF0267 family)